MNRLQTKEMAILANPATPNEVVDRLRPVFSRARTREQSGRYIGALMRRVERKNSWQLAEAIGDDTPYRLQSLLGRSVWDAESAVAVLQQMVAEKELPGPRCLILDDTGFVKKGDKSVGVQSQYCGRTGKIDNCQTGVFLALESTAGTFLVDRRLYMPKRWISSKCRRREACVPEGVEYKNKAELGREMVDSALARGLKADWILGDSIYGNDPNLRRSLENRGRAYILGVPGNARLWRGLCQWKLSDIAKKVPMNWSVLSCGQGTKKLRKFRWAVYDFPKEGSPRGWKHGILFRQSLSDPKDITSSRFFALVGVSRQ